MEEPLSCDDRSGDDLVPIWVPAGTFLATFGLLLFRGICRSCFKKETLETSKEVTDMIVVFAVNTLVLTVVQLKFFEVAFIGSYFITAAIVLRNFNNLLIFSQERNIDDREACEQAIHRPQKPHHA